MVLVAVTAMSSKLAATANKATATINTPLFSILIIVIAFTVAERKCWMVRYKKDPLIAFVQHAYARKKSV